MDNQKLFRRYRQDVKSDKIICKGKGYKKETLK